MFPFYLIFSRKHRGFGKEILTAVSERLSLLINKGKVGGGGWGGADWEPQKRAKRAACMVWEPHCASIKGQQEFSYISPEAKQTGTDGACCPTRDHIGNYTEFGLNTA